MKTGVAIGKEAAVVVGGGVMVVVAEAVAEASATAGAAAKHVVWGEVKMQKEGGWGRGEWVEEAARAAAAMEAGMAWLD